MKTTTEPTPRFSMSMLAAAMNALALLTFSGSNYAVRGADTPPPAPEAVRAANSPSSTAQAPRGMRQGQITALDMATGRVEIDGGAYRIVDGQTRVYRKGRPVALTVLTKGQLLSFSVSPGADRKDVLEAVDVP